MLASAAPLRRLRRHLSLWARHEKCGNAKNKGSPSGRAPANAGERAVLSPNPLRTCGASHPVGTGVPDGPLAPAPLSVACGATSPRGRGYIGSSCSLYKVAFSLNLLLRKIQLPPIGSLFHVTIFAPIGNKCKKLKIIVIRPKMR